MLLGGGDGEQVLALYVQWARIEPFLPKDQPGPERKDDRQIIPGILRVLSSGCRWRDCPVAYDPRATVYNRFNRWSRRGFRKAMLAALAKAGWAGDTAAFDSSYVRAHRCAHGGQTNLARSRSILEGRPSCKLLRPQLAPQRRDICLACKEGWKPLSVRECSQRSPLPTPGWRTRKQHSQPSTKSFMPSRPTLRILPDSAASGR